MTKDSTGASLEVHGATKLYDDVVALDGISLDIRAGEFLTLLGPSGSGKTTTLNAIAGFIDLTEGEIYLDGAPIAPIPTHRRNIGVIFQNYALFPHMTARANVAYALKQRKVPRSERNRRVQEALDLVGLGAIKSRYPRELSGGQQQRVALARAIVFQPRVLLMDEPLGALDRKLREGLQREIKSIHRDLGITFVYVTHDQEEALALSDRIAVFNEGHIEQIGNPIELYERPSNRFVAAFMGESNIFDGAVSGDVGADRTRFDVGGLSRPLVALAPAGQVREACLIVRPQRINLSKTPTDTLDNSLTGTVTDVSYLGPSRRITADVGGISVLVRDDAYAADAVEIGERVHLGWNAADGLVVPGSTAELAAGEVPQSGRSEGEPSQMARDDQVFREPMHG